MKKKAEKRSIPIKRALGIDDEDHALGLGLGTEDLDQRLGADGSA